MKGPETFQSALGPSMARYLDLKRTLGRRYANEGRVLESLDRFLTPRGTGANDLTAQTFEAWCRTLETLTPTVRRSRMRIIRNFCLYRRRSESSCFVPDVFLFPAPQPAERPYIFSRAEIIRLIEATHTLKRAPGSILRPELFRLALVLLYTTGLRRGELLGFLIGDYDPTERLLRIRQTKFHKSRLLPLSRDGVRAIETYLDARRAHHLPTDPDSPLIWNGYAGGRAYTGVGLGEGWRALLQVANIRKPDGRPPRIHDLRHTFAVHALLRWYRSGADVQAKLPYLATYMGHVSIVSTQYYLHFIEPLAQSAGARFARHCAGLISVPSQPKGARP